MGKRDSSPFSHDGPLIEYKQLDRDRKNPNNQSGIENLLEFNRLYAEVLHQLGLAPYQRAKK